jgi:hypothetical protein
MLAKRLFFDWHAYRVIKKCDICTIFRSEEGTKLSFGIIAASRNE